MQKSLTPLTDYFRMVLLTDPTFGETHPVFLLRTDDKYAYYLYPDTYLALVKSNSLKYIEHKTFHSPYHTENYTITSVKSDNIMFTSSLDLNWFHYSSCIIANTEKGIKIESIAKQNGRPFKSFYFNFDDWHNEAEIKNHLPLLYFFSSNINPTTLGFYKYKKTLFPVELASFSIDFPTLFKEDLFYYFSLYIKHFSSREELLSFQMASLFSSKKHHHLAGELLTAYFNEN